MASRTGCRSTCGSRRKSKRLLSAQHKGLRGAALRVALGHDLLMTSSPNIGASYEVPGTPAEYVCDWGVRWQWVTNPEGGRYTEAIGHPLAEAKDLTGYRMPDPLGPEMQPIYAEARDLVQRYGETHAIFGSLYQTVFEAAWLLRGMANLLADMATDQDFAHELFERLTDYSLVAGREMVAQGVDVLWLGDDFGTQRGMLISPKMWRTFIKERYARLIAAFKAQNPALKIAYHCDGTIQPIIPDLIEIGLDVLNPDPAAGDGPGGNQAEVRQTSGLLGDGGRAAHVSVRHAPGCGGRSAGAAADGGPGRRVDPLLGPSRPARNAARQHRSVLPRRAGARTLPDPGVKGGEEIGEQCMSLIHRSLCRVNPSVLVSPQCLKGAQDV